MMRGGERKHMVAKLYGGAHVLANELKDSRVGQKNVDFVRKYLSTEGIPIVHQKLGGKKALRVSMKANSGSVVATELEPTERPDLSLNDQRAITKANEQKRKDKQEQITFF